MSIFENSATLKDKVDDTHPLKCKILNSRNTSGYTEYVIEVTRTGVQDYTWKIFKRYSDFVKLQNMLYKLSPKINLDLPPKKIHWKHGSKVGDATTKCLTKLFKYNG